MQAHLYADFFFQYIHTTGLHSPRLVKPVDVELCIQRASCKVISRFSTSLGVSVPNLCTVHNCTRIALKGVQQHILRDS